MRRQSELQSAATYWVAQPLDLDPFDLPVRYNLFRNGLEGEVLAGMDHIILGQRSVVLQHQIFGYDLFLKRYLLSSFQGVAIRIMSHEGSEGEFAISVNLHHQKDSLCLPLFFSFELDDVGARWQSWGRVLRLPLLIQSLDGTWSEPVDRLGKLTVKPTIKRNPKLMLATRRPKIMSYRDVGSAENLRVVSGTEIIARD